MSAHPTPPTAIPVSPTAIAPRSDGSMHDNSVTGRSLHIHGVGAEPFINFVSFAPHELSFMSRPGLVNNCVTVSGSAPVPAETTPANSPLISPEISVIAALRSGATTMISLSNAEEIQSEIERLIPRAETGEQWAHICLLEKQMLELTKKRPVNVTDESMKTLMPMLAAITGSGTP